MKIVITFQDYWWGKSPIWAGICANPSVVCHLRESRPKSVVLTFLLSCLRQSQQSGAPILLHSQPICSTLGGLRQSFFYFPKLRTAHHVAAIFLPCEMGHGTEAGQLSQWRRVVCYPVTLFVSLSHLICHRNLRVRRRTFSSNFVRR